MRPLTEEEAGWLDKFYKEEVHGTFITDAESTALFREAKRVSLKKANIDYFSENGKHSEEVKSSVKKFNDKSKSLGNIVFDFWSQREINSDSYKRRGDIHNNAVKGIQLQSFEDFQGSFEVDGDIHEGTVIEDLITQSED